MTILTTIDSVDNENPDVNLSIETKIIVTQEGIGISFKGYGCGGLQPAYGDQIWIEVVNSIPRVLVYADINKDEPTETIPLVKASEMYRE